MQQLIKNYILVLWFLLTVTLGALILVIIRLDPTNGKFNLVVFYLDFAILIYCASCLVGYYLRKSIGQREYLNQYLKTSLRQSLWFSSLATISLLLKAFSLFTTLNVSLFLIALIFLESFFLVKTQR